VATYLPDTKDNFETCPPEFPEPGTCDPATCLPSNNCACARSVPPINVKDTPQVVINNQAFVLSI